MKLKWSVLIIVLAIFVQRAPFAHQQAANAIIINESPQYWETSIPNPRGVFVVAHGLNLRPSKMGTPESEGTLVKLLLDSGYHVYRVTLKGHSGPLEDMQSVTWDDWMSDAYSQYCQAKSAADSSGLPLYLLGFSLGALVYEVLMNEQTAISVMFEKTILFSPAVAIRPATKVILRLRPFVNDRTILKSAGPIEYRAQAGASIAAYRIVSTMEKALCSVLFKNCNVNTIVFIDKKDEVISSRLLRNRINKYELTNWKIIEVTNTGSVIRPKYHHLLIDNNCVSPSTWQYISETMLNFLGAES